MTRMRTIGVVVVAALVLGTLFNIRWRDNGAEPGSAPLTTSTPAAGIPIPPHPADEAGRKPAHAASHDPASASPLALATLHCRVRTIDGRPVPGATIALRKDSDEDSRLPYLTVPDAARRTGTTGEDGSVAFTGVEHGPWDLVATADGLAQDQRWTLLDGRREPDPVEFVLRAGHPLAGRVLTHDGTPVADAEIAALRTGFWMDGTAPAFLHRTGPAGQYRFPCIREGSQQVLVRMADGVWELGATVMVPSVASIDIRLRPRAALEGRVLDDATGSPVAGARVDVDLRTGDRSRLLAIAGVVSDVDGRFRFPSLPSSRLLGLTVTAPGYLRSPDGMTPEKMDIRYLAAGTTTTREVRLHRGGEVTGILRTAGGVPVADAWVRFVAWSDERWEQESPTVRSGPDGRYTVRGVHPGTNYIQAGAPRWHGAVLPGPLEEIAGTDAVPEACRVVVPPTGIVHRDIVLHPDGRAEGVVVGPDGEPLAGFVPELAAVDGFGPREDVRGDATAADGRFVLEGIVPGRRWKVVARGPGGRSGDSAAFTVEDGGVVAGLRIRIPARCSVTGRLRREDGAPLLGATVAAVRETWRPMENYGWRFAVDAARFVGVDGEGRFRIDDLDPGPCTLLAVCDGCAPVRGEPLELVGGEWIDGQELVLLPGQVVAGTVVDEAGAPLEGVSIFLRLLEEPNGPEDEDSVRAVTDAAGNFRCGGLAPASYALRAHRDDRPDAGVVALAGEDMIRIVMEEPRVITGRVVQAATGAPLAAIEVTALSESGRQGLGDRETARTVTDESGRFRLEALATGTHQVVAGPGRATDGWALLPRVLGGVQGGTENLEISLEPDRSIEGRVVDGEGRAVPSWGLVLGVGRTRRDGTLVTTEHPLRPDGTFVIDGLAAGPCILRVAPSTEAGMETVPWAPTDAMRVEAGRAGVVIVLRRGRPIRGRIVDADGNPPDADPGGDTVWITLHGEEIGDEEFGLSSFPIHRDWTFATPALDDRHRYRLWVSSGTLEAVAHGVAAGSDDVVLRPDAVDGRLAGVVVDESGAPVGGGMSVWAKPVDGGEEVMARTRDDGSFLLEGLPRAPIRLRAGGDGSEYYGPDEDPVAEPDALNLVLGVRRGCTLAGVVRGGDGTSVMGLLILETVRGGRREKRHGVVGGDGSFRVAGLPPGEVAVRFLRVREGEPVGEEEATVIARLQLPCDEVELDVSAVPVEPKDR